MIVHIATVETATAPKYLGQSCKHFSHKYQADYTPDAVRPEGLAQFAWREEPSFDWADAS